MIVYYNDTLEFEFLVALCGGEDQDRPFRLFFTWVVLRFDLYPLMVGNLNCQMLKVLVVK